MVSIRICTALCVGILGSAFCALAAQDSGGTASVVLTTKDESGATIPNAHVQVVPSPQNLRKDLSTGMNGELSLRLPSGNYFLTFDPEGFVATTRHIEVHDGIPQSIEVVLKGAFCSQCMQTAEELPASFPENSPSVSPDGRYTLVNVDNDTVPHHSVFLDDGILKTRRKLLDYEQYADFLWSPDSKLIAVNDFIGNDSSKCSIVSVDGNLPPIQVLDLLFTELSETTRNVLEKHISNRQAYVEVTGWGVGSDSGMIQFRISGYGEVDSTGFTKLYNLRVSPRGR